MRRSQPRDLAQLVRGPLQRLRADWQDPLLRNGYALIVNVGVTSVLGLAYWILAARLYTPTEVGIGVAAINLMQFLAGVGGQLTFQAGLTRFIPHAGRDSTRLALLSYGLAGGAGVVVSLLYIAGLHIHALGLPVVLGRTWILSLALGASVTVWCVFALQDAVLTGIRQAVWIPVENGLYGIGKIVLLVVLAHVTGQYGIFASWTVPALIALLPVNLLIFGRLLPRHVARTDRPTTVTFRTMSRFMGGDYLGTLFFMSTGTLLPVLILARLGKANAAYFGVVYVIIYALDLITVNLGVALMVEGAIDRASLRSAAATVVRRLALIVVPAVLTLLAFAPLVLSIYGHDYAVHGAGLLRLLGVAVLAKAVTSFYIALSRVERRVSRIALAQGTLFVSVIALSWWLMGTLGINGVGVAYLISQVAVAAALLPSILRMLAPMPAALAPADLPGDEDAVPLLVGGPGDLVVAEAHAPSSVASLTRGSGGGSGGGSGTSTQDDMADPLSDLPLQEPHKEPRQEAHKEPRQEARPEPRQEATPEDPGRARPRPELVGARQVGTPGAPRRVGLSTAQMALLTFAALVMGILALLRVDSAKLGDLGLVTVAGPTYFVAVALIVLSFGFALVQQPLRRPLLAFQIIGLIMLLDGLGPLVEPHASFATAWLHSGFAQYIATTGHTLPGLDARFSWPGFFALAAFFSKAAGLNSPVAFLRWAPLVFNLMYLAPLYAISRAITRNERVWWMGLALFYLASWVGQDYFSPQALSFFLFLVIVAVTLRWFRPPMPDPGKGNAFQRFMSAWMRRLGGRGEERTPVRSTPAQRGALIVLLCLIFAAMAMSHQLTPFLVVGGLLALLVFGRTTLRGLPLLFGVITVAWISLGAVTFWSGHLNFIFGGVGQLGANVNTSLTGRIQGSAGRLQVLDVRLALAGAIFLLALIGALRRRRLGYGDWSLLLLAFAPFPLLGVQDYGGEALLRAYLFALPFVALLAAMAFLPSAEPSKIVAPALAFCLVAAVFAPAWLIARYGNERFDRVSTADLAAVQFLYATAPQHSTLISLFPQLPWRYQKISNSDYDYESVQNTADPPTEKGLEDLATDKGLGQSGTNVYLIITRGQEAAGEALDSLPPNWAYTLAQTLVNTGQAVRLYANQDAAVLQLIPPALPPGVLPGAPRPGPANPGSALS